MVEPAAIVGAVVIGGIAIAAVYSYLSGEQVKVQTDDDSEPEFTFGDKDSGDGALDVNEDVKQQANPLPDRLQKIGQNLTEIKGIGETRKKRLNGAGYITAADIYLASDDNLTDVKGIGSHAVDQIRSDIGYLGEEGNGESSGESDAEHGTNSQDSSETDTTNEQSESSDSTTTSTTSSDQSNSGSANAETADGGSGNASNGGSSTTGGASGTSANGAAGGG